MTDAVVVPLMPPELGATWTHTKGTQYVVLEVSSSEDGDRGGKFPVTILYLGPDGRIWPRTVPRWHEGMTFHKAPRFRPGSLLSRLYLATLVWHRRRGK